MGQLHGLGALTLAGAVAMAIGADYSGSGSRDS